MKKRDEKRSFLVKNEKCLKLNEEELQKVIGKESVKIQLKFNNMIK